MIKLMKTKQKKITAVCILTMLFIIIFTFPAAAKNNIALECKIDSFCGESSQEKSASMLVDNDPNYDTKWEASDGTKHPGEPHWIILDFGADKMIDSIRLVKASQGAKDFGRTEFDASGFRFEISSDKKNWAIIDEVTNDGDRDIHEAYFIHAYGRYLKLTVTNPEHDEDSNDNQAVRLYDLKVFEKVFEVEKEYAEDSEETFDTEVPSDSMSTITAAPQTSDLNSMLTLVLWIIELAISTITISRIFSNPRSRSV